MTKRSSKVAPGRRIWVVSGTRPEVLKLAPVVAALRARGAEVTWIDTGQQAALVDRAFAELGLAPDRRLGIAVRGLGRGLAALIDALSGCLAAEAPCDQLVVHGDTTSALAGALAAFYAGVPVAHVEAGLRSHDPGHPFPEEQHRVLIDRLATWWLAPTVSAHDQLLAEGCDPARVHLVGNPVVDALHAARGRPARLPAAVTQRLDGDRPVVLVTCHRRENHGRMEAIATALRRLQATHAVVVVRHPHPATAALAAAAEVVVDPLDQAAFVQLLDRAQVVLTDSGGVQEEAVASRRRALVLRQTTERPEGVALGWLELVGTDPDRIVAAVRAEAGRPRGAAGPCPYGEGDAGARIAAVLLGSPAAGG